MVTVETKPTWNSSSFLIYTGGLTVLEGALLAIAYLFTQFSGAGQMTAWVLLIFVILFAIAHVFWRADRWLAAGIFAFISVIAWGILVGAALHWWGWQRFGDLRGWSWHRVLLEVLILFAATVTRWRFEFPFIRVISALVGVFFVFDLLTKFHGNPVAVVAFFLGFVYLALGSVSDKPSTFWLHLVAGLLIGVPIIYWGHTTTEEYVVIAFVSLAYVVGAYWTKRSSWAVYGTIGFFIATTYFVVKAIEDTARSAELGGRSIVSSLWFIPLSIGLLGFWLILLGMLGTWKKGVRHGSVKTEIKPVWTASSFLVYTGGFVILLGAIVGLVYLGYEDRGDGARTGWTLLFLVIVYGIAHALRVAGRWVAAGILAFVSVLVWAALVLLTMHWIGWHPFTLSSVYFNRPFSPYPHLRSPLSTWSWSRMLFWVLVLAAASYDRRVFKFPLIRLISALVAWLFIADLLTSGQGNWFETVALVTGLVYLLAGNVIDKPSAFWLHLIGGLLIASALVHWFSTSDGDFAVLSIFAVLFVLVAYWTRRSSWAVFGTIAFFAATYHYLGLPVHTGPFGLLSSGGSEFCRIPAPNGLPECTTTSFGPPWSPALAFGLLGFWLVGLGLLGMRKRGYTPTAVVVQAPPPPAPAATAAAAEPPAA